MPGVRGRSGRKSIAGEDKRQRVIDRAWEVCNEILNDPNASMSIRADMAKTLAAKSMPQQLNIPGGIHVTLGGILSAAARRETSNGGAEAMARQSNN